MKKITFTAALIISALFSIHCAYSSISILSYTPTINALNVSPSANITIQFSASINAATLTGSNIRLYGSQSGLHNSLITFNASNNTATIDPNADFRVGEIVEAIVTQGVKSTTNDSLAKPFVWRFNTDVTLGVSGYILDNSIPAPAIFGSILFDCDNDGDLDAAASDHDGGIVIIYKNNGSGNFSVFTTLTGGGLAYTTYAPISADFNCDGNMDLAVPVRFSNLITFWFGNGTGNFSPVQQVGVDYEPESVTTADFNGDGYIDIVTCCNNSGAFFYDILMNDKTGHFNRTQQVNMPNRPDFCTTGDVDGDGDIDIFGSISSASLSNCYVLINDGSGTFSVSQILVANTGYTPAPGDLDGDGDIDLIVNGNATSPVFGMKVLKNNGAGTFVEGQSFGIQSVTDAYGQKFIQDINNDGYLDLVTSIGVNIEIYTNDGSGNFSLYLTLANNGWPAYALGIGDLNGNGNMGICTPGNTPWVLNIYIALAPPPPAPVLISPANNSVGNLTALTLVWNKSLGALNYRIQLSSDSLFNTIIINDSTLTDSTRAVSSLNPLTNYWWRVNAKNAIGTSAYSTTFKFRTLGVPAQITGIFIPANGAVNQPATINFMWSKTFDQTLKKINNTPIKFNSETILNYWYEITIDSVSLAGIIRDSLLTDTNKTQGGFNYSTSYYWRVKAKNQIGWGSFSFWQKFTTAPMPAATVTLKIIPGGFYNPVTGTLRMRDTLNVYLVDSATCQRVDSNKVVLDSITFSTSLSFSNAPTGNYYLYIYHRNHLPVASMFSQNIIRGANVSYDLTTDSTKAYGFNLIEVSSSPDRWGMIPGDADRDEFTDGLDQTIWIAQNGLNGYRSADFNGDGFVDGLDQIIWIQNNGASSFLPCMTPFLDISFEKFKRMLERNLQFRNNNTKKDGNLK